MDTMDPTTEPTSPSAMLPMQKDKESSLDQPEIRISGEMFTALMVRVEGLETKLTSVKNELSTLQQNCGGAFIVFPKLPPELRRRIWFFGYRAPQTHIISSEEASRSKLNSVFNACSEARQVRQSLKLDYFRCSYRDHFQDDTAAFGTVRNYINPDIDTLWLTRVDEANLLPGDIEWVCGRCEDIGGRSRHDPNDMGCIRDDEYVPFRRMAINFPSWKRPGESYLFREGTIQTLINHKVSEVLLVVGNFEQYERSRDVRFVTPHLRPIHVKHAISEAMKWGNQAWNKKWSDMEENTVVMMKSLKDNRAERRKKALEEGRTQLDIDPTKGLEDLSGWEIPEVRFVEARTASHDWVLPPKENQVEFE